MAPRQEIGESSKRNLQKQQNIYIQSDQSFNYDILQYHPQRWMQRAPYLLVRPPRFIYNDHILTSNPAINSRFFYQEHNIPFSLSIYKPKNRKMQYIILFLHANSSSKIQGLFLLDFLPINAGLACFDFSGCGNRYQTQYVTLGIKQSQQVNKVGRYLKQLGYLVIGWGRSMGSVSLLLSSECDIMVVDSPFYSLDQLLFQSAKKMTPRIFGCCLYALYPCLKSIVSRQVQRLAGFKLEELNILQKVKELPNHKCILFMAGNQDQLIGPHHCQILFQNFAGKNKKLLFFEGTHESQRNPQTISQCFQFIQKNIPIHQNQSLAVNISFKNASKRLYENQLEKIVKSFVWIEQFKKYETTQINIEKTHEQSQFEDEGKRNCAHSTNDMITTKNKQLIKWVNQQFIEWQQSIIFGNSFEDGSSNQQQIIENEQKQRLNICEKQKTIQCKNTEKYHKKVADVQMKHKQNVQQIFQKHLKLPNLVFSDILKTKNQS